MRSQAATELKIRNPNIEIRNKLAAKELQNCGKSKTGRKRGCGWEFGIFSFGFVSNFGFRASNFESRHSITFPASITANGGKYGS
jgi:hypothetical protein